MSETTIYVRGTRADGTYEFTCTGVPTIDGVPVTIGVLAEVLVMKGCWGVLVPDPMAYGAVPSPKFFTEEPK